MLDKACKTNCVFQLYTYIYIQTWQEKKKTVANCSIAHWIRSAEWKMILRLVTRVALASFFSLFLILFFIFPNLFVVYAISVYSPLSIAFQSHTGYQFYAKIFFFFPLFLGENWKTKNEYQSANDIFKRETFLVKSNFYVNIQSTSNEEIWVTDGERCSL